MSRVVSWCLFAAVLQFGCGPSETAEDARVEASVPDPVRAELIDMGVQDQTAREGLTPEKVQDSLFLKAMLQGDSGRTRRLRELVGRYGWPTEVQVGPEAAHAAFLILQHSPEHDFQREMLPALEEQAQQGAMPPSQVAMLVDRVLVHDGKPQRYGTQFSVEEGRLVLEPVEDEEGLEARRREMQLPPMEEYIRLLEEQYEAPVSEQQ